MPEEVRGVKIGKLSWCLNEEATIDKEEKIRKE
jgi:hypothetical protein